MLCDAGFPVHVRVHANSHSVLVTGKEGPVYTILDPGDGTNTTLNPVTTQFQTRGYISDPPITDWSSMHISVTDQELVVTDPSGKVTGYNSVNTPDRIDIPQSFYYRNGQDNGETGVILPTMTRFLEIRQPASGVYTIEVHGASPGPFEVKIKSFSADGSPQPAITVTGIADIGSVTTFQIQVTSVPGTELQIISDPQTPTEPQPQPPSNGGQTPLTPQPPAENVPVAPSSNTPAPDMPRHTGSGGGCTMVGDGAEPDGLLILLEMGAVVGLLCQGVRLISRMKAGRVRSFLTTGGRATALSLTSS
jgi:hypothetical protein